jgi:hypothetical protein
MCFKNIKNAYMRVKTKHDYIDILRNYDRFVQETDLCPDFERRKPGTGYRG